MRVLRHVLGGALSLLLIVIFASFAVMNRQAVPVWVNPLGDQIVLPLYLLVLVPLAGGFMLGALVIWLRHIPLYFRPHTSKLAHPKLDFGSRKTLDHDLPQDASAHKLIS